MAVNGIVRIQAGVRGWIARSAYGGPFWNCFPEDVQRAVVRIQAGVRGWIVRRHVVQIVELTLLEDVAPVPELASPARLDAYGRCPGRLLP